MFLQILQLFCFLTISRTTFGHIWNFPHPKPLKFLSKIGSFGYPKEKYWTMTCAFKVHVFIKKFLSKTVIFDKYSTYLTKLPGIWQIWWYLITKSACLQQIIHYLLSNTTKFVKYVKYLSNSMLFDRKHLTKKWSLRVSRLLIGEVSLRITMP